MIPRVMPVRGGDASDVCDFLNPASPPYASVWNGKPTSFPVFLYVQAWYGQRKRERIAGFGPTHLHAPVPAHVEQHPDLTVFVPHHDERIIQNASDHIITGIGDLGLVREELPARTEKAVAVELVQLRVAIHASRYLPRLHLLADLVDVHDLPPVAVPRYAAEASHGRIRLVQQRSAIRLCAERNLPIHRLQIAINRYSTATWLWKSAARIPRQSSCK